MNLYLGQISNNRYTSFIYLHFNEGPGTAGCECSSYFNMKFNDCFDGLTQSRVHNFSSLFPALHAEDKDFSLQSLDTLSFLSSAS